MQKATRKPCPRCFPIFSPLKQRITKIQNDEQRLRLLSRQQQLEYVPSPKHQFEQTRWLRLEKPLLELSTKAVTDASPNDELEQEPPVHELPKQTEAELRETWE